VNWDMPFDLSNPWWRAKDYTVTNGGFIAPSDQCVWPDGFEEYRPFASESNGTPYEDLLNTDARDIDEVLAFAQQWGLLGTALRWHAIDPFVYPHYGDVTARPSWGDVRVITPNVVFMDKDPNYGVEYVMRGDQYFEHCFKRHPKNVLYGPNSLQEVYGEWVDPGPELTSDPPCDSHRIQNWGGVAERYQTFTVAANDFAEAAADLRNGIANPNQSSSLNTELEWQLRVYPSVVLEQRNLAFRFSTLLDACYLMLMFDHLRGRLHKCPECHKYWRDPSPEDGRGGTKKYCPEEPYERGCRRRAHDRKNDQRRSWRQYLEDRAPHLLETLPKPKRNSDYVQHPIDLLGQPEHWSGEVPELASMWASRVRRKSQREFDEWIDPILAHADNQSTGRTT